SFVCATVEGAPRVAGTGFDGVYTSWGVLCWLPDLSVWAATIDALLRPGGWLYLAETHPYATALRGKRWPYGGNVAVHNTGPGDYTDPDAEIVHDESWEWSHGLGEIVTALAQAGLRLEYLH